MSFKEVNKINNKKKKSKLVKKKEGKSGEKLTDNFFHIF